jgi:hypothetical protein
MESLTGGSVSKLAYLNCLDRLRIASILPLLVRKESVAAKDRTLFVRPFVVCILYMLFFWGLMQVGSAGAGYPPFWQHGFRIGLWRSKLRWS